MSITYAGTKLAVAAGAPVSDDLTGYELMTFDAGECAIKNAPNLFRDWAVVTDDTVCSNTNVEKKGSSKWAPVEFKISRIPTDTAQAIYVDLENSRTGVGSFRLTLPGELSEGGIFYFTALVAMFALADGGGQDDIHTSAVKLLIQSTPIHKIA